MQAGYQSNDDDQSKDRRPGPSSSTSGGTRRTRAKEKPKIDDRTWQQQSKELLKTLFERSDSVPFRFPVDILEYPDYNQVIDVPMDLTSVGDQLSTGNYETPAEFAKDVRLIFANSKNYNTNNKSKVFNLF